MGKIIEIFDYKKEIKPKETLTKEEIMEAKADLLYDDDRYLDMFFEEDHNDKIEIEDIDVEAKLAKGKELLELLLIRRKDMRKIIDLEAYSQNKRIQIESYSMSDMIVDPKKRKEVYDYYDKNYKSTQEEDEICNKMRGKYREED
ncbi:hypothetical protein EXM90_11880 [Clostridium botulinum]|uniref:hypothetical protein n=1 Tax=Clostridium botulinum TaxID=1491 RepID=UPI0013F120CB|nr:hypothetical protein [Clostridium botulinum]MBN3451417.1 hypothetical protein [Clostridium botulinum]NFB64598.1 hypothetical protein [Clostridium botulinum]NFB82128.1 hypothetical protein [Clostridium botulinum]NFC02239.1 hypothetical protein [Clostridium botulinum]NFC09213.1 hypothetical protein [Clostridium botulinum]